MATLSGVVEHSGDLSYDVQRINVLRDNLLYILIGSRGRLDGSNGTKEQLSLTWCG